MIASESRSRQREIKWVQLAGLAAVMSLIAGLVVGATVFPMLFRIEDLRPEKAATTAGAVAMNNATVGLVLIAVTLVTFSIGAQVILFINGLLVGQLIAVVISGGRGTTLISGLLPHLGAEVAGFAVLVMAATVPVRSIVRMFSADVKKGRDPWANGAKAAILASAGFMLIAVAALLEGHFSHVTF